MSNSTLVIDREGHSRKGTRVTLELVNIGALRSVNTNPLWYLDHCCVSCLVVAWDAFANKWLSMHNEDLERMALSSRTSFRPFGAPSNWRPALADDWADRLEPVPLGNRCDVQEEGRVHTRLRVINCERRGGETRVFVPALSLAFWGVVVGPRSLAKALPCTARGETVRTECKLAHSLAHLGQLSSWQGDSTSVVLRLPADLEDIRH